MRIVDPPAHELVKLVVESIESVSVLAAMPLGWNVGTDINGQGFGLGHQPVAVARQTVDGWVSALKSTQVRCTGMTVNATNGPILQYVASQGVATGTFTLSIAPGVDSSMLMQLHVALEKRFMLLGPSPSTESDPLRQNLENQAILAAQLLAQHTRLQDSLVGIAEREGLRLQEAREKLEDETARKREALEQVHEQKLKELESAFAAKDAAHAAAVEAHSVKVRAFETREEKYVRRQLLPQILEELTASQKHTVSPATEGKRASVTRVVFATELVAGILLGVMLWLVVQDANRPWYVFTTLTASFATMVSTAVFYLRWLDRWFRDHANAEFLAARYKADMLRASWVAELAAEMKKSDAPAEIPPELLQAMTRSLFAAGAESPPEHPVEQLLSLVRRGTELRLAKGEVAFKAADPK